MIRPSLICICFDKWLHIGDPHEPTEKTSVIKPAPVITASDNITHLAEAPWQEYCRQIKYRARRRTNGGGGVGGGKEGNYLMSDRGTYSSLAAYN